MRNPKWALLITDPAYSIYKKMHIKCCSKDLAIQLMLDGEAGVLAGAWTAEDDFGWLLLCC